MTEEGERSMDDNGMTRLGVVASLYSCAADSWDFDFNL